MSTVVRRRVALAAGAISIAGMAVLAGCSSSDKPAEGTSPSSKPTATEKVVRSGVNNSFSPTVKAKPAPTALPGGNQIGN